MQRNINVDIDGCEATTSTGVSSSKDTEVYPRDDVMDSAENNEHTSNDRPVGAKGYTSDKPIYTEDGSAPEPTSDSVNQNTDKQPLSGSNSSQGSVVGDGLSSDTPTLCKASCGFYGSGSTNGYCSRCYKALHGSSHASAEPNRAGQTNEQLSELSVDLQEALGELLGRDGGLSFLDSSDSDENNNSDKEELVVDLDDNMTTEQINAALATALEKKGRQSESGKPNVTLGSKTNSPMPVSDEKNCFHCQKSLSIFSIDCRCGHKFCLKHKSPWVHSCSFDYHADQKNSLEVKNPNLKPERINKL